MLDSFVKWASRTGPRALKSFGKILGNTTIGVAGFFRAFQPAGFDLLSWLETATAKFRAFGEGADNHPDVKGFIEYVRDVGPIVTAGLIALGPTFILLLSMSVL